MNGNTLVDFRNVFCAICNGLNPATVKPWDAAMRCPQTPTLNKNTIRQILLQPNNSDIDYSCSLELAYPNHTRECPLRQILKDSYVRSTMADEAQSIGYIRIPSFRHLFDFNVYFTTQQQEDKCGENQKFAPFYQKCLKTTSQRNTSHVCD